MTRIRIEGVVKRFGATTALDDVTLDLPSGSFTALLGASGCGKTTLLRVVAGFERPNLGRVLFDDRVVCDERQDTPPEARNVGVVFQSYALWPHLSVAENVAYPLRTRGVRRTETNHRVAAALAAVGLDGAGERSPDALSGGQRQRVALARCMVAEARVIVFDEPLANLDMHLRAAMVESFRELHDRTGATVVYVTHDQSEALALADRIAVLHAGRIAQFATPQQLYAAPRSRLVAEFVGRGRLVAATAAPSDAGRARISLDGVSFEARCDDDVSGSVAVLLRPEALALADHGLPATVTRSTFRGPVHEVEVRLDGRDEALVLDCSGPPPPIGSAVRIAVADAWVVPEA